MIVTLQHHYRRRVDGHRRLRLARHIFPTDQNWLTVEDSTDDWLTANTASTLSVSLQCCLLLLTYDWPRATYYTTTTAMFWSLYCAQVYVNGNQIDFSGIPAGIGKLSALEVFSASSNNLEMIPEGVCRCGKLKKLILNSNRLITLPDAIHYLTDLEVSDFVSMIK